MSFEKIVNTNGLKISKANLLVSILPKSKRKSLILVACGTWIEDFCSFLEELRIRKFGSKIY